MGEKWRSVKRSDRLKIEKELREGYTVAEIAVNLQFHRSTIYRELKRGRYVHRTTEWTEEDRYSPEIADEKYRENLRVRGTQLKIGRDYALADYIDKKIVDEKYSPEAVVAELDNTNGWEKFSCRLSIGTIYSYLRKGVFPRATEAHLAVKGKKKYQARKKKVEKKANAGPSIDLRPRYIDSREEFGHWELDSVEGKQRSKRSILVFTERKTRYELLFKVPHTAKATVEILDDIERQLGDRFRKVFKSITVDNGTEFSFYDKMVSSCRTKGHRTQVYYCHAYHSWERGTNEVNNRLIRRHIPKGTDFDNYKEAEFLAIQEWMNNYPRRLHRYRTAQELYTQEVEKL